MDLGIPRLRIKDVLGTNPLKSGFLVRELTVPKGVRTKHLQRRKDSQADRFQSTKSGAGEQFPLKDCKANICTKGFSHTRTHRTRWEQHEQRQLLVAGSGGADACGDDGDRRTVIDTRARRLVMIVVPTTSNLHDVSDRR